METTAGVTVDDVCDLFMSIFQADTHPADVWEDILCYKFYLITVCYLHWIYSRVFLTSIFYYIHLILQAVLDKYKIVNSNKTVY